MGFFKKLFAGGGSEPFMEHPTGKFKSAIDAMEDAIRRLRNHAKRDRWITFTAQGQGDEPESYEFYEVRMRADILDVGDEPPDLNRIIQKASTGSSSIVPSGAHYSVAGTSPREAAQLMDAIFRHHFDLRPFADEGDDYAVGAEW